MTNTVQIPNDQMIFSVQELKDKGFSYYKINQMVDKGILIKLNKKYYENVNFDGEESDFYYAYAFVPDGVVCLLSAAVYYNLSTYRPDAIDVAIPSKAKVSTLPDWPELNVCYFTDNRFDVGIVTVEDGNNRFRIYDIEKTVVDGIFYFLCQRVIIGCIFCISEKFGCFCQNTDVRIIIDRGSQGYIAF